MFTDKFKLITAAGTYVLVSVTICIYPEAGLISTGSVSLVNQLFARSMIINYYSRTLLNGHANREI